MGRRGWWTLAHDGAGDTLEEACGEADCDGVDSLQSHNPHGTASSRRAPVPSKVQPVPKSRSTEGVMDREITLFIAKVFLIASVSYVILMGVFAL